MIKSEIKKPVWLKMTEPELKKIIAELADKHQPAEIGLILRDQYGVPTTKVYGKKLSIYLEELGIENNIELKNAEKKLKRIEEHLKENITDKKSKHKQQKLQSRFNLLRNYYKK